MFILGRFGNTIFPLNKKSVLWGNLITLQGIHNTDDVIACLSLSHEQNAGKSYLRNPPHPSTKYMNLLSCLYFIELLSAGPKPKTLKIPISANSFQLAVFYFQPLKFYRYCIWLCKNWLQMCANSLEQLHQNLAQLWLCWRKTLFIALENYWRLVQEMLISQTKTSPYRKWYAVTLSFIFEKTIPKTFFSGWPCYSAKTLLIC